MNRTTTITTVAAIAALLGSTAIAQETALQTGAATDRNEDLRDAIDDDFERETTAFGNQGRSTGFDGSLALRGSVADGNTDKVDIGVGVDLGYYDGVNGYGLELSYSYGELDGEVSQDSLIYDFEYRRDFSDRLYGFAKVQGTLDQLSNIDNDVFVGLGAGYRIYNTNDLQWSVQAGPGYRVSQLSDGLSADIEGGAIGVSSNFYSLIQPGTAFSIDTDIVASEDSTKVTNLLALTQNVSNQLALRTSLSTTYNSDPVGTDESTDNVLGVSLVYSFN